MVRALCVLVAAALPPLVVTAIKVVSAQRVKPVAMIRKWAMVCATPIKKVRVCAPPAITLMPMVVVLVLTLVKFVLIQGAVIISV